MGDAKDDPERTEALAEEVTAEVSREEMPPTLLARIDPDDSDAEVMLSIRQEVSARKARSAEKARKEAETECANSTPTKSRQRPDPLKKAAVRKTVSSTSDVPLEPAASPEKPESVTSPMFRRKSLPKKNAEKERAEKSRLISINVVPDASDVPLGSKTSGNITKTRCSKLPWFGCGEYAPPSQRR